MPRPLIGITAEYTTVPIHDAQMPSHLSNRFYVRALVKAGATPVVLPIGDGSDDEAIADLLDRVDGLLVSGGIDIDPASYGRDREPATGESQPDRDAYEFALVREAVDRNLPTLAICRGIQTLNTALGGTLVQDLPEHSRNELWNQTAHGVSIEPGSLLARVVGETALEVNSLHHQAVDDTGSGVRVVARADDGTVEAIEIEGAPDVLGVQWHPEMIRHRPPHLALFRNLVAASSRT